MKHLTAHTAQEDFFALLDDVARYNEPVTIVSDDNKVAVVVSIDEWNSIQETIHLQAIPGMVESIKAAAAEPLTDGVHISEVDFGV